MCKHVYRPLEALLVHRNVLVLDVVLPSVAVAEGAAGRGGVEVLPGSRVLVVALIEQFTSGQNNNNNNQY